MMFWSAKTHPLPNGEGCAWNYPTFIQAHFRLFQKLTLFCAIVRNTPAKAWLALDFTNPCLLIFMKLMLALPSHQPVNF